MTLDNSFYTKMVDDLILFAEHDEELSDGIKWLDGEAGKRGITFYEMVLEVLQKHDTTVRAKKWVQDGDKL